VLADRVKDHPIIDIQWNTILEKIEGKALPSQKKEEGEEVDLDNNEPVDMIVSGAVLKDVVTGELRNIECDAVFIAIGHLPNTGFLKGVVEFDPEHAGYVKTYGQSTKTSVPGIFAAGDVTDAVYRQAITSAGSGAAAALDAERYLSEEGLGNEAAELEAELMAELAGEMNTADDKLGYNAYEEAGGRVHGIRESVAAEL
jgi:thioredoxin reductase (NADPH)